MADFDEKISADEKKISQKNPKKIFSKFCIHQNASKMHILAGRGDMPKICPSDWTKTKRKKLKYIPFQLTGKVYCDRQL